MQKKYQDVLDNLEKQDLDKKYKLLLDQVDNLMIALKKQKSLGLDSEVIIALKNITKSRNDYKRKYLKEWSKVHPRHETVFHNFLDVLSKNV